MTMEQTLIMIKPDGVKRRLVGQIIQRFEQKGMTIVKMKVGKLSRELAESHYQHTKGRDFYEDMMAFMTSSEVVFIVLEGESVIEVVRQLVGATNPLKAAPGTIRGDFGSTSFQNIIHASDSPSSAKIEIERFFGED